MTAEEARELSKKGKVEQVKDEYITIMKHIEYASEYGLTSYTYPDRLYNENIEKLKKIGYKVECKPYLWYRLTHSYEWVVISWREN